jgi:hypothetical protein
VTFALADPTLFGLAAAISSISGVVLAWASHRQGRKDAQREAEKKVHEELLAARREAEELSAELHRLRMEHPDEE